ncbi:MAG: ABC-type lipoprotein release transport system permease subunit [Planctomycetota bacterium]
MIRAFSPYLALRYLVTRRINILGVLGVAFAVWAMLVVDGVFTGFVRDIRANVESSAPPLLLTDLPHDSSFAVLHEALADDPDVVALAPRLRQHAMLQPIVQDRFERAKRGSSQLDFDHTKNGFAMLIGIDPLLETKVVNIPAWLQRGADEIARYGRIEPPSSVFDEPNQERLAEMLLPDPIEWDRRGEAGMPRDPDVNNHRSTLPGMLMGWRRVFNLPHIQDGDPFEVVCASFPGGNGSGEPRTAVMRTTQKPFASAGWFSSGNRMFDEVTALVPIEALRTMLGHDIDDLESIPLVTDVAIRPRDGLTGSELIALQRRLENKAQAELPEGSEPCSVLTWQEQNSVYLKAVEQEHAMMQIVLMIVMLVSAFVIYATLHMMVVQKIKDIGIVSAVGGSPRSIGAVFLINGTVVGVLGSLFGVVAGILSAIWINPINDWLYENYKLELFPRETFDLQGIPCHLETSWVVGVATGAIVLSIIVAFIPARKAARMNPVTALSFE